MAEDDGFQKRGNLIRINDRDEIEWVEGLTVSDLLKQLGYNFPRMLTVVKIDGQVVPHEEYPSRTIPNGADVRVVTLIAGG